MNIHSSNHQNVFCPGVRIATERMLAMFVKKVLRCRTRGNTRLMHQCRRTKLPFGFVAPAGLRRLCCLFDSKLLLRSLFVILRGPRLNNVPVGGRTP